VWAGLSQTREFDADSRVTTRRAAADELGGNIDRALDAIIEGPLGRAPGDRIPGRAGIRLYALIHATRSMSRGGPLRQLQCA
jgi:hypothetical protein